MLQKCAFKLNGLNLCSYWHDNWFLLPIDYILKKFCRVFHLSEAAFWNVQVVAWKKLQLEMCINHWFGCTCCLAGVQWFEQVFSGLAPRPLWQVLLQRQHPRFLAPPPLGEASEWVPSSGAWCQTAKHLFSHWLNWHELPNQWSSLIATHHLFIDSILALLKSSNGYSSCASVLKLSIYICNLAWSIQFCTTLFCTLSPPEIHILCALSPFGTWSIIINFWKAHSLKNSYMVICLLVQEVSV